MPIDHVVKKGDCITNIAAQYGFLGQTVWHDNANQELRQRRRNPNLLMPGDVLTIADKQRRQESAATEQRHRFVRLGIPARFRLVLLKGEEPRANEAYELTIDGKLLDGTTDDQGRLEIDLPPDAKMAELSFENDDRVYELEFGAVGPADQVPGYQARLNNLGYDCGSVDGILGDLTRAAIVAFQERFNLEQTGEPDDATLDKLRNAHDTAEAFEEYVLPPEGDAGSAGE